jgi:hypothetical protein
MPPTAPPSSGDSAFTESTPAEWPLSPAKSRGPSLVDVTAHRFSPVDRPTAAMTVNLPDHAAAYRLVASAVTVAVDSLAKLELDAHATAAAFRALTLPLANLRLLALVDGLRLVTTLAQMAADAAKLDLTALPVEDGQLAPLDQMGLALDQLTAYQFAEDWTGVAATLETDLAPALSGWREVFATILLHADVIFRERRAS